MYSEGLFYFQQSDDGAPVTPVLLGDEDFHQVGSSEMLDVGGGSLSAQATATR